MKTMIVAKAFRPTGTGSRMTIPGDEFEADPQQERLFRALGWLKDAPPKLDADLPAPKGKGTYRRRDMAAERPAAQALAPEKGPEAATSPAETPHPVGSVTGYAHKSEDA